MSLPTTININGDRMKERREFLGMTQAALAARVSEVTEDRIRVSRGYLAELELNQKQSGRHKQPRRRIALALADALAIPITFLEE